MGFFGVLCLFAQIETTDLKLASPRVHFKYTVTREALYYRPHNEMLV